jgi:hypothetical protein
MNGSQLAIRHVCARRVCVSFGPTLMSFPVGSWEAVEWSVTQASSRRRSVT